MNHIHTEGDGSMDSFLFTSESVGEGHPGTSCFIFPPQPFVNKATCFSWLNCVFFLECTWSSFNLNGLGPMEFGVGGFSPFLSTIFFNDCEGFNLKFVQLSTVVSPHPFVVLNLALVPTGLHSQAFMSGLLSSLLIHLMWMNLSEHFFFGGLYFVLRPSNSS